jgi:UDP-perosamine 4-acetyltransferase
MMESEMFSQPLVMIGAGGHAKVLHSLAMALGHNIVGVCDPQLFHQGQSHWRGVPVLGGDEALDQFDAATVGLINGIGQLVGSRARKAAYERLRQAGFSFPALVHPAAWVASNTTLEQGVQVMAGAVVQPDCCVGENSIINTHASIDHDCAIGAHVHIAPGATLCGGIRVLDGAFIAAGATVIQGVTVGFGAVVGAGSILTRDLAANQVILGSRYSSNTATKLKADI